MAVVNKTFLASIAQAALNRNDRALGSAMEQLSTGRKINSAADNASALLSTRMTSQIRGLDQQSVMPTMPSVWLILLKARWTRLRICCSVCASWLFSQARAQHLLLIEASL